MKHSTKLLALWLPMLVAMTLAGWIVLGALPGVRIGGDLVAWLLELPVTTCYAIAAGGACVLGMSITGMNIPNDRRLQLCDLAAAGDRGAFRVLVLETIAWLAHLAFWALFFFPHW